MARRFKPDTPYTVACKLLVPTTTIVKGVRKTVYPDPASISEVIFISFKTYGGDENFSNDVYQVFDTARVETWYRPDIKADCQIYLCEDDKSYKIVTPPEDVDKRHQYMTFKVERVGGKP